jgi:hypothetical protein
LSEHHLDEITDVSNRFFAKIRARQTRRVNQYLHKITKDIVELAKESICH